MLIIVQYYNFILILQTKYKKYKLTFVKLR